MKEFNCKAVNTDNGDVTVIISIKVLSGKECGLTVGSSLHDRVSRVCRIYHGKNEELSWLFSSNFFPNQDLIFDSKDEDSINRLAFLLESNILKNHFRLDRLTDEQELIDIIQWIMKHSPLMLVHGT